MIYLLDADQNGSDSIQHLVNEKRIAYFPVAGFQQFEAYVKALIPIVSSDDLVIIDTISSLQESTIMDARLGTDIEKNLWELKGKYLDGDKNYLNVYNLAGDTIIRRLKNLRARGARIITTSHEAENIDPTDIRKKRAPRMSPALYDSVMRSSSDVARLSEVIEPILDDEGAVKVPTGTRLLQIRKTEEAVAKYHVRPEISERIAEKLIMPTIGGIHKYYAHIDKRPAWLHLYGPPGVGKTSLCASEAESPPSPVGVTINTAHQATHIHNTEPTQKEAS